MRTHCLKIISFGLALVMTVKRFSVKHISIAVMRAPLTDTSAANNAVSVAIDGANTTVGLERTGKLRGGEDTKIAAGEAMLTVTRLSLKYIPTNISLVPST